MLVFFSLLYKKWSVRDDDDDGDDVRRRASHTADLVVMTSHERVEVMSAPPAGYYFLSAAARTCALLLPLFSYRVVTIMTSDVHTFLLFAHYSTLRSLCCTFCSAALPLLLPFSFLSFLLY